MKTNKLLFAVSVAGLAFVGAANASIEYDFTFTSSGMDATGVITVGSGVATIGSITVTGVPIEHPVPGDPTSLTLTGVPLLPGSGNVENVENHNGDVVTYDNLVNFLAAPVLDGNGLGFGSGQYGPTHYNTLIGLNGGDLYGNYVGPNVYTLFVGEAGYHYGEVYDPEFVYAANTGTMTFTAVPEPTTMIAGALLLLPFGASTLRIMRRNRVA